MLEDWYFEELISKKIRDIWKLTDFYLLKILYNIIEITKIDLLLRNGTTINDIIITNNYNINVFSSIKWILDRLKLDDFLSFDNNKYFLTDKKMTYELFDIYEKAKSESPDSVAAFNMLKLMSDNYPAFLEGKKNGVEILFSPETMDITNEYYCNNLFYNVHNIAGAKALNLDMETRNNPTIVEIGGGTGGGVKQFVNQRLSVNNSLTNFNYTFSDIANKLLRTTRRELNTKIGEHTNFNYQKLDFNRNLSEQGYNPESIDIIWGVNALHVAKDLRFTLHEIIKTLKKGGSLIISETVRPVGNKMIQQEFILNTLHDYWDVKIDPDIRPRHGFMEWKDWVKALSNSGFTKVETIPDMNIVEKKYDNCYVSVIHGIK